MLLILIKKLILCAFTMHSFLVLITLCVFVSCDSVATTKVTHQDELHSENIAKKVNHLNDEVNTQLTCAHVCEEHGDFKKASQAYLDYIQLSDSLNKTKLHQKVIQMQESKDIINAQLLAGRMERQLDARKNNILSISTITLNAIGTLLLVLLIYCIHNHHHLQKYNTKLKEALTKAQEGVRIKENFMYHITHEISTPLKAIVDSSTSLDELHQEDEEMRQYLDIIDESGRQLTDVISGILNVSDLQNTLLKEQLIMQKFNNIVDKVIDKHRPRVHKGVEISYTSSLSKRFLMPLRCNSATLVLDSLVDNAVKYTHKGTIALHTCLNHSKSALLVTVQDTGVGICDADKDKIFDLFFKGNGYELGGGAGLFIAKQIIEARKGTLELDKEYNNGARFVFSIPINC